METKQTAVEWLYENLPLLPSTINDFNFNEEILLQAKQMEKEQIINAFVNGEHQQGFENESEQYYNETYGN